MTSNNIAVIGLWHLGEVFSVGLAELGQNVIGIDSNDEAVKKIKNGVLPLDEPDLVELLKKNTAVGRLAFETDYTAASDCEIVWVTQDTPVDDNDEVDVSSVREILTAVLPYLRDGALLVFSSQLPVGTCRDFKKLINQKRPDFIFGLAYVPENLQLGRAVKSFFEPGRIVIGAESESVFQKIEDIFKPICSSFLRMNLASAEMAKHALNSFLAASLSFTYDIADMCESMEADILDVSKALRSDPRIGQAAYLDASIGFSGGTLGRDLKVLLNKAGGLKVDLPVIRSVFEKNAHRKNLVISRLEEIMGNLGGTRIGILGVTYKPGTSTLRRSLALEVSKGLEKKGVIVSVADPGAIAEEVRASGVKIFSKNCEEAMKDSQAVVLMTAWPEFKNLDFQNLARIMQPPRIFFDTRNFFHEKEAALKQAGFKYLGVGRGIA